MGKLLPVILGVVGLGAGLAAGSMLRAPDPAVLAAEECAADPNCELPLTLPPPVDVKLGETEFATLNKQFVVPIIDTNQVSALVVASISLEVKAGTTTVVFQQEPKLRDAFLQVLFVHAHSGGFSGQFTAEQTMADLRGRLVEVARAILGDILRNVLITEIVRQDM